MKFGKTLFWEIRLGFGDLEAEDEVHLKSRVDSERNYGKQILISKLVY